MQGHHPPIPLAAVAERFGQIILGMLSRFAGFGCIGRWLGALHMPVYSRISRLRSRFAAICARAAAGTLPLPRPPKPKSATDPAAASAPAPRGRRPPDPVPCAWGWLCRLVPEANFGGPALEALIRDSEEMRALLAASPEARRICRALIWMTAANLPDILKPPEPPISADPDAPRPVLPRPLDVVRHPGRPMTNAWQRFNSGWPPPRRRPRPRAQGRSRDPCEISPA